jgi:enamine deaminase RidA (YjgF/YER057c/UK114 family)
MADAISIGLPQAAQPFSWATRAGGLMFTTHGPVDGGGAIVGGDIREQTRLTLSNLAMAVQRAEASMADVAQVLVYLSDAGDIGVFDEEYRSFFEAPYPNRACVAVKGFVHPAMRVELVAYVALTKA